MAGRAANGRFLAGNEWASEGGKARAAKLGADRCAEIARLGFEALVDQRFEGNEGKAIRFLIARDAAVSGQQSVDSRQ
jgi:hypothetical protein